MSLNYKKSIALSAILVLLGVLVLYAGSRGLVVLMSTAGLVWYWSKPVWRSGRN